MWVFFDGGFVSIVEDQQSGEDLLLVRARSKEDLIAFCRAAGSKPGIIRTDGSDYRYRVRVPRRTVRRALTRIAEDICYPNFKDRVHVKQGTERARIYADIWQAALPIDERHNRM